jgi:outer membrane protein assembly factor BamA
MEDMDFLLQLGKNQQVEVVYSRPYIDRRKHFGVGVAAGFRRMREAGFLTRYDRLEYMFDRRFLSQQYYGAILFYYRRGIHTIHSASVRIEKVHFADTLLLANPDYFFMGKTGGAFLNFFYKLKIDHRDARYYPLSGWYTDLEISKSGFGMQFEGPVDIFWIKSASRYYKPLSPRWYFGAGASVKWSSTSDQPYYFMQGLGYERDFVRGYEYYVVDGEDYSLFRANLKFAILPQRVSNIACIPSEKFSRIHYASYLNLYADVGYVWNSKHSGLYGNELPESLLYGAGLGMDVVTYYDKVLRVEFSVNKSGESGIFIHFIAGI